MGQQSSGGNHRGMTSGKTKGEEGDATEVAPHDGSKGRDGRQVVGTQSVQNPCQEDHRKQQHTRQHLSKNDGGNSSNWESMWLVAGKRGGCVGFSTRWREHPESVPPTFLF